MVLEFCRFELKLRHPWAIASSSKADSLAPTVLVRLSDGDLSGLGEAPTAMRYDDTPSRIEAFLRRMDASRLSFANLPASAAYLDSLEPASQSAKCALNTALLDGAARAAGQPIYDYLKLGFAEDKHLTSMTIGIDTPEQITRKTAEAAAFPILKLKVGVPEDAANLAALRRAAPAKKLRVDANEGWATKEEALRQIEWLARDGNIEFIEQPLSASAPPADFAWLKQHSPLPLFADESYQCARDVERAAECFHGVNVKLVKTGGPLAAQEALFAARRAGLKTMLGCMIESNILISAAAHLSALTDHLDIDGALLTSNDPCLGVTADSGLVSFSCAPEKTGLRAALRDNSVFARHA